MSILSTSCAFSPGVHIPTSLENTHEHTLFNYEIKKLDSSVIAAQKDRLKTTNVLDELLNKSVYIYKLQAGDQIDIKIYTEAMPTYTSHTADSNNLDLGIQVDHEGNIFYPQIGEIHAAGKSVKDLRKIVATALKKYIKDPQVDIRVLKFASQKYSLIGAVNKSNIFPITTTKTSLVDAIGLANGFSINADTTNIELIRNNKKHIINYFYLLKSGYPLHNIILQNNDVINVNSLDKSKVYVMGEVNKKHPINIATDGLNLTEALGISGGLDNRTSNAQGILIFRSGDKNEIYKLNLNKPAAFFLANEFQLQKGDIIYVTTAPITRWNRLISQIFPSIALSRQLEYWLH